MDLLDFLLGFLLDAQARGAHDRHLKTQADDRGTRLTLTHDGTGCTIPDNTLQAPLYHAYLGYPPRLRAGGPLTASWGVSVSCHLDMPPGAVQDAVRRAYAHCDVPVRLDDTAVPQAPFLPEDAPQATFNTPAGTIGAALVYQYPGSHNLCAAGLLRTVYLPFVPPIQPPAAAGKNATLRLDVSRTHLAQDLWKKPETTDTYAFLDPLREPLETFLYRALVEADRFPLSVPQAVRARKLGVNPDAMTPRLLPLPPPQPYDDTRPPAAAAPEAVNPAAALRLACSRTESAHLHRALSHTASPLRLYQPTPEFAGHAWYDALPQVTAVQVHVINDGQGRTIDDWAGDLSPADPDVQAADHILVRATMTAPGDTWIQEFETDVASSGDVNNYLDATAYVARDATPSREDLALFLEDLHFEPADEADLDHPDLQLQYFREEALHAASRFLDGRDEAVRRQLLLSLKRRVLPLIRLDNHVLHAIIDGDTVTVRLTPRPEIAANPEDRNHDNP